MQWIYKDVPLKEYLKSILKDKSEIKYLYSTVRRILSKEFNEGTNLDLLISDVLSRDKIKKIIDGEYIKQEKQAWNYQGILLKEYLSRIIKNKDDLKYLYDSVRAILEREYTIGDNLDLLIEDILQREKIESIISGKYTKSTEEKWEYKELTLTQYIEIYIKSKYRSTRQIRQNIEDYVTSKIKRENLSTSAREGIITEYINSPRFRKFIMTPPKKRQSYFYKGERLYQYLKKTVTDKQNLNYIYCLVIAKISKIYSLDSTKDLNFIVEDVMTSNEVVNLINAKSIMKINKELWPYKEGLLIDYLRSIDLNDKKLITVYLQVKHYVKNRYPSGFKTIIEKRTAIETYVKSEQFAKYIKYGYTNKVYFYKGMLLIDYIKLYYGEVLKTSLKTPDNLYSKILSIISRHENIDILSLEETEQLIDDILKSDEIKIYLNKKKTSYEVWRYNNRNLKDVILEIFYDIIEDDFDLYRIYAFITRNARKLKLENPKIDNNDIISSFLTDDFVKIYKTEYVRKKEIRKEVKEKNALYDNRDDFDYICLYAANKNLDINKIINICKYGFNYYSAIIILEYSLKFNTPVKKLIDFTLNNNDFSNNYLLWLFKLGFKDYISDVVERNKRLINMDIYRCKLTIFNESLNLNFEDIYSFLNELLITKHIAITVPIDRLFASFRLFIQGCIKRYFLEMRKKLNQFKEMKSLDDEYFYTQLSSNDDIEEDYIKSEENTVLINAINELNDFEREFIDLRYGFSENQHSLQEIKKILEFKGIFVSSEELGRMDIAVLNKLRNNPNILKLCKQI